MTPVSPRLTLVSTPVSSHLTPRFLEPGSETETVRKPEGVDEADILAPVLGEIARLWQQITPGDLTAPEALRLLGVLTDIAEVTRSASTRHIGRVEPMSQLDQLLYVITAAPDLPGAACRHMWAAFDPAEHGEDREDVEHRHQVALRLCRTCPALGSCRTWFDALPRRQRPLGVVAGRVNGPNPPGRPKVSAS